MLKLTLTKRTDPRLLKLMDIHYSQPKGFVGRNMCYAVEYSEKFYGYIVGGSATKHLAGRHEFLGTDKTQLNNIINNIFYHIEPINDKYPKRNFSTFVIAEWVKIAQIDWQNKFGNEVVGFETLIELPRTGECYRRAGWTEVGMTKGFTCKRVAGNGTDSWSGKRVWDTKNLRPKRVFCLKV
jgi:hypothetical protein